MAANGVWELLDHTDSPLRNLGTVVPTLVAQGTLSPGHTAAKLETMASAYTGRRTPYDSILLNDGRSGEGTAISDDAAWHSASVETIRIRRADPLIFNVSLKLVNGEALVSIRCNSEEAPNTEWAVYLYRERTKIAERWYSTERTARFPVEDGAASSRFRALVFSRRQGHELRVLKRYSDWREAESR